ncbi:MAG: cytochrome P450 [Acidimicrobiia bacterium]|nr:cytochrome P450 [Acidimicrobiia bacterium]
MASGEVMRREEIALSMLRVLVKRPRLANVIFRFDKWGNILGPDRFVDPYPIYERMRAQGQVSFSPFFQQWAVVGFDEARDVLSSPSFGVAAQLDLLLEARPYSQLADSTKALLRNALLFTDPPLHTRLRSVVHRAFTPGQMRRLEPHVAEVANRLIADIADDPEPDLMRSFAEPLPINVIADLIGVPEERWAWVARTSTKLREVADPFVVVDPASVDATCDAIADYYGDLADERLADPRDDLLTSLVQAEADDGTIDRAELISIIAILMLAGHETTTGALGNSIVALARHPAQRRLVRENPELWPNAVEELLRFDTAIHTDPRVALETTTIAGQTIEQGQNLTVMLGAVNRDPRRFTNPNQLALDRENPAGLSFGHGIHHCIGAALARLELRIGLRAVIDTFGDYTIQEGRLAWKTSLAFRSPTRLLVRPGRT